MAADRKFEFPVHVAPATGGDHNTVRERLIPVAAWQIDDVHFQFDSSFVLPESSEEFALLAAVRRDNPGGVIALFGHADPVGNDEYNKELSGRRATAIYAVLTRRPELWEELHAKPHGRDKWDAPVFATMRSALQQPDAPMPASASERRELYAAYMELLCRDLAGQPYRLAPADDFLARGADKGGKGDRQGCGEFNPELLLARDRQDLFARDPDHTARDEANAPNRRVVALVFAPGSRVDPAAWPCPRADESTAGCRRRLWSDSSSRRTPGTVDRRQLQTQDTYQCRFYERLAPPRLGANRVVAVTRQIRLLDEDGAPMVNAPWTLTVSGVITSGSTGDDGIIKARMASSATEATLRVEEHDIKVSIERMPSIETIKGVQVRLHNLGYLREDASGKIDDATKGAVRQFQHDRSRAGVALTVTGEVDEPTRAELAQYHGS